jgi:hypothetical protein
LAKNLIAEASAAVVGQNDVRRAHVVDPQPELAAEDADAARRGQPSTPTSL